VEYALIVMVQGELSEEMSWLLASMFPRMEWRGGEFSCLRKYPHPNCMYSAQSTLVFSTIHWSVQF
jgi:hypothetical protein